MKPRAWVSSAGIVALAAMLGLLALQPAFLQRLELALLDWRFRVRGPVAPEAPVAVIAVDARAIDTLGRWPWRRSVMAALIDRLAEAGTLAIALDVVFSEPEASPERDALHRVAAALGSGGSPEARAALAQALAAADTDAELARAMARSGRTVGGFFFRTGAGEGLAVETAGGSLEDALQLVRKAQVAWAKLPASGRAPILRCVEVEPDLAPFADAAARLGFFSATPDVDGVVRTSPLIAICGDQVYVSLDLAVIELLLGERAQVIGDDRGVREVRVGQAAFPTDEGGRILVNYRGHTRSFPHYSVADVLDGSVGRAELEGVVAVVGVTEVGLADVHANPFGKSYPGVEVHANVVDNLLSGSILRRDDRFILAEVGAVLVLGLGMAFVVPFLGSTLRGLAFALVLFGLVGGGVVYAFVARGLWLLLAWPASTLIAVYGALAITQGVTVEARARRIRRQFATYVPPEVVEEMTRHPERFRLGGERRDLSILFSDVADFTTISEEVGPERVVELLNVYLTPMTRIVFESHGTLDKYIGDAIVAFWGAPLPVEQHALRACESALAMQEEVQRLRESRPDVVGVERLTVRIGLHTGEVSVGNMGSDLRFDYTATGDVVNVCSRLEGLNKYYGTRIMASEDLVRRLPPGFLVRELDSIRVKGRRGHVTVFEVLGRRAAEGDERELLEGYAAGLGAYRKGRFAEARRLLSGVDRLRGDGDGPARLLLDRIDLLERATPADWSGIWSFETK